jgi:hypothetical protein
MATNFMWLFCERCFQSIDANITLETQTPKESTQKIASQSFACLKSTEKE